MADFLDRDAPIASAADELQLTRISIAEIAVVAACAIRRPDQSDGLVVADQLVGHAGRLGGLAHVHEGSALEARREAEGRARPCVWRLSMGNFNLAPIIAVAAAVAFVAGPAAAHARLVSATPAPNATVATTRTVSLTFSERTVPAFSGFDVVNAAGEKVAVQTSVAEDGKTLTGTLARPLAVGAYRVDWRIASSDGHRMTGSYTFSVR